MPLITIEHVALGLMAIEGSVTVHEVTAACRAQGRLVNETQVREVLDAGVPLGRFQWVGRDTYRLPTPR
jgi:hypothetical protein